MEPNKSIGHAENDKYNQSSKKMKFSKPVMSLPSGEEPMHMSNDNKPAGISMDCNDQLDSDEDLARDKTLVKEMNVKGLEFIDKNRRNCTNTHFNYVPKPPYFQYSNYFGLVASSEWKKRFTKCFNILINHNHSVISLETNEQNPIDIKSYFANQSRNKTLMNTHHQMDKQQAEIREFILSQFKLDNRRAHLDIFTILGIPGSGKTFILQSIKDNENIRSIYISKTDVQINEVAKKHHIQSLTVLNMVTRMLCIKHIPYATKIKFMDALNYLQNDIFSGDDVPKLIKSPNVIGDFLTTDNNESAADLAEQHGNLCIFFDQMCIEPPGLISLVLYLLRLFAKHYNLHIVLLLVGDFDKIPPSDDYSFLLDQSVKYFYTSSQHRINSQCMEFITELKKAAQDKDCLQLIRNHFEPAIFAQDIEYSYPISKVINKHKELNSEQLLNWFKSDNIATEILNLRLLTFTNDDVHYNNIALATSIFSQLYFHKARNIENKSFSIDSYIKFSLLAYKESDDEIFENNLSESYINILPLIRYFPYRLLSSSMSVPQMSIVYLIQWFKEVCYVYEPNDDIVLEVKKQTFYQLQFKHIRNRKLEIPLYGFPLQMAYASTFHLSQGETISGHKICFNLFNPTKKEIYAMFSRINDETFVHRIGL